MSSIRTKVVLVMLTIVSIQFASSVMIGYFKREERRFDRIDRKILSTHFLLHQEQKSSEVYKNILYLTNEIRSRRITTEHMQPIRDSLFKIADGISSPRDVSADVFWRRAVGDSLNVTASAIRGQKDHLHQRAVWALVGGNLLTLLIFVAGYIHLRSLFNRASEDLVSLKDASINTLNHTNELIKVGEKRDSTKAVNSPMLKATVSSIKQFSSSLNKLMNSIKNVTTFFEKAAYQTGRGKTSVDNMLKSMDSINRANQNIQKIADYMTQISNKTKSLNQIVFKTQLLSLNAAIEAQRAGSHGRGFSTVAEEIGNLAKLSGSVAKSMETLVESSRNQIGRIISSNQNEITSGIEISKQVARAFGEIEDELRNFHVQIENLTVEAKSNIASANSIKNELNNYSEYQKLSEHFDSDIIFRSRASANTTTQVFNHVESLESIMSGKHQLSVENLENLLLNRTGEISSTYNKDIKDAS